MHLIYRPEGVKPLSWDFTVGRFRIDEAEAVERQTGQTIQELGQGLKRGSAVSIHAFLWLLLRRDPGRRQLRFDEVTFVLDEVTVDLDDDEKQRVLDALQAQLDAGEGLSDLERQAYDQLTVELAEAPPKGPAQA